MAIAGAPVEAFGWEYVHVGIDEHSRIAYVEVLADQLGRTCARFLERAGRMVPRARYRRPARAERQRHRLCGSGLLGGDL
jgi:hypothetical protein